MVDVASVEVYKILQQYLIPTYKGSIFNTDKIADTNIFASNLTPTKAPSIFRIYICLDTAAVVTVKRTYSAVTVSEKLNSGASLTANCAYLFDIFVDTGETINLQISVGAKVLKCSVIEIPMGQ